MPIPRTTAAAVAAAALLAGAFTGCNVGGDGGGPGPNGPTSSPADGAGGTDSGTPSSAGGAATPYLPVPDGVVLADPGSEFSLGETANVAWELPGDGGVGVLAVKVRKLFQAKISDLKNWQLDLEGRRSSLYYVTVTVANLGDADLGATRIPLYVRAANGTLVESSEFKTDFNPCPSLDLPDGFATGDKVTLCQAYQVPKRGRLQAVAFAPTPTFNPVTWVGKVKQPKPPKKAKKQE